MPLPANWVDNIGMEVDADFLNQVGEEVNSKANTEGDATGLWMGDTLPGSGTAGVLYVVVE